MADAVRLSDGDWDILLPGDEYQIGNTKLMIKPLGLKRVKAAVTCLRDIQENLAVRQITSDNFTKPENITYVVELALERVPDLIAESSGLHLDDVLALPPEIAIGLVTKVLSVNIDSQKDLGKNLKALAETIGNITETGASATSATS